MAKNNSNKSQRGKKQQPKQQTKPVPAPRRRNQIKYAPVAGSINAGNNNSGVFAPVVLSTNDLLSTIPLGDINNVVAYVTKLGPQELPPRSRAATMARMYARYSVKRLRFSIASAIPTTSGGQFAVFWDGNPKNNWNSSNALGAITSMPCHKVMSAWDSCDLDVPSNMLKGNFSTDIDSDTTETLMTNFGQIVVVTLVAPAVTAGTITLWVEATWEFSEPNATNEASGAVHYSVAGDWTVATGGVLTTTVVTPPLTQPKTVYKIFPQLPDALFLGAISPDWIANFTGNLAAFDTKEAATEYAISGTETGILLPSATPTLAVPASVIIEEFVH